MALAGTGGGVGVGGTGVDVDGTDVDVGGTKAMASSAGVGVPRGITGGLPLIMSTMAMIRRANAPPIATGSHGLEGGRGLPGGGGMGLPPGGRLLWLTGW